MTGIVWVCVKWLAIGAGCLASVAAIVVGVLVVAALFAGGLCEDVEDENEERLEECRRMLAKMERKGA